MSSKNVLGYANLCQTVSTREIDGNGLPEEEETFDWSISTPLAANNYTETYQLLTNYF